MISAEGIVWNGLDRRIAQTAEAIGLKRKPEYYENFCEMLYRGIVLEAFFDMESEKIPFDVYKVLDEITSLGISELFVLFGEEEETLEDVGYLAFGRKLEITKMQFIGHHLEKLSTAGALPTPIIDELLSTVSELCSALEVVGSIEQMIKLRPGHLPEIPIEKLHLAIRRAA